MANKRVYLALNDLFFNMVITLKEANIEVESLTYSEVEDYGAMIQETGKKNELDIILVLSKSDTCRFYNDYYDYVEENSENGIKLKKECTKLELIELCRGYLPLDILMTILDINLRTDLVNKYANDHNMDNVSSDIFKISKKNTKEFFTDKDGIIRERKKEE